MPLSQTASVPNHDIGLPAVAANGIARFKASKGGKLSIEFENADGVADGTVSVEVSADDSTYAATSVANNGAVVTNAVIQRGTRKGFTITLRQGLDNFLRINGSGGTRLQVQFRGDVGLQLVLM